MNDFLKYVAEDLLKRFNGDFSDVAVVFPNKRASLFLNNYLIEESSRPMWSPHYITISELFRNHSNLVAADRISLIFELFKCYSKHVKSSETIDSFYNWGEIMLADFDDIDKNMADADAVFSLTRDYSDMDNLDYLSEVQREKLKEYFNNSSIKNKLKENFTHVYQHLADIYHEYNNVLRSKGTTYEGALYREVAENIDSACFKYKTYVFVGFNMLQKVEEKLFAHLAKNNRALFYWDFDKYYTEQHNGISLEAGHYISRNIRMFPNALDCHNDDIYDNLNNGDRKKNINIVSATTENAQARYITQWLDKDKICCGRKTAVVMCDESMLQSAIHCLPDNDSLKVNITTGYPLQQTPVASFVSELIDLMTEGYDNKRECFLMRYVIPLLNHPYAAQLAGDAHALVRKFRSESAMHATAADIAGDDEFLNLVFTKCAADDADINVRITKHVSEVLKYVASNFEDGNPLYSESIFRMFTLLQLLGDTLAEYKEMKISITTFRKLINQVIAATSIPFHGEPINGIQLMGVLETRNIDFDNILLLSCNEGNMPKGIGDTSFIPYTIRKGFGLTTVDHKVDIYAYYFYRMMQRAGNVTIVYNSSTDGTHKNEMSRFALQMIVEQCHNFRFLSLDSGVETTRKEPKEIVKDEAVMAKLNNTKRISPSALNTYLRCGLRYYYSYIADIKEPELIMSEKEVDYRTFGLIFHKAAELLYNDDRNRVYTESRIKAIASEANISRVVSQAFISELFNGKAPESLDSFNGIQRILYNVICRYIRNLLTSDMMRAPFEIVGTEQRVNKEIRLNGRNILFSGIADRIDKKGDVMYIVDYKTGSEHTSSFSDVSDLFNRTKDAAYDYYIQTILYSIAIAGEKKARVSPVLLYISKLLGYGGYPVLKINKAPVEITEGCYAESDFMENITAKLNELFAENEPFRPATSPDECSRCPFFAMCYGKEAL